MIAQEVAGGTLLIDPTGATVQETATGLLVEIPVQFRHPSGTSVGYVYIGTEPIDVVVREAHTWVRTRALGAHFQEDASQIDEGRTVS